MTYTLSEAGDQSTVCASDPPYPFCDGGNVVEWILEDDGQYKLDTVNGTHQLPPATPNFDQIVFSSPEVTWKNGDQVIPNNAVAPEGYFTFYEDQIADSVHFDTVAADKLSINPQWVNKQKSLVMTYDGTFFPGFNWPSH